MARETDARQQRHELYCCGFRERMDRDGTRRFTLGTPTGSVATLYNGRWIGKRYGQRRCD